MKFMMIVPASKESEAGVMPSAEILETMAKYNDELIRAGVLLEGRGCIRARRVGASSFPETSVASWMGRFPSRRS